MAMELSKYEQRRNVRVLEMQKELQKRLQDSKFSDPTIDARILQGTVSTTVIHSGSARISEKEEARGRLERGGSP
jgi:hypothetical protein